METEWIEKKSDPAIVERIVKALGCYPTVATLLVNRGIETPEAAKAFLNTSLSTLTEPFALKDMERAVTRVIAAVENREKILIFGDFDADGITSTAILNDFLTHADGELSWYIPHRTREGYGLKRQHITMAAEQHIDLIITVDCGSDSFEAIELAILEDIDVIVTDHHEVPDPPPRPFALVNPKQKDCPSGLCHLAGVGVAFYLIIALRMEMRKRGMWQNIQEPNLVNSCDLVALGTIADMVPLTAENRILSIVGIDVMRQGKRPGLKALFDISRIDNTLIDSDDIAFRIAPRINAAGRMAHARICIDLLCSKEKQGAEQKSTLLDQLNKKRQQTEQSLVADIEQRIAANPELSRKSALVMSDRSWNPGVLGIAASKIAKKYAFPVVLISTANTPATGSCRSVNTINIHSALKQCKSVLERFGGHAMAAGISILKENINNFSTLFESEIASLVDGKDRKKVLDLDCILEIDAITPELVQEIDRLRPFGMGNPEPLFFCKNVTVIHSTIIGTRHRKMVLQKAQNGSDTSIEALQFNIDNPNDLPNHFKRIAFRIRINRFNNKFSPQIIIEES